MGNGAGQGSASFHLDRLPADILPCKAFFRPSPSLTIKANGELATCRLGNVGEGYGNIHDEGLVPLLNGLQECFISRLHAERRIETLRDH